MTTLADFSAPRLLGGEEALSDYVGNVVLVVNTASACGLTPQFEGLEKLYRDYKDRGFDVLGFPCNQFAEQEKGSAAEIAAFCETSYDVTFPMFSKVEVNGRNAHPLYKWLKQAKPGPFGWQPVMWNFGKFLIDRDGKPVKRYAPTTTPDKLGKDIGALL